MPSKWVSNAAKRFVESHDGHFGFCPANSQLYRAVVKARGLAGQAIAAVCGSWQTASDRLIDDP
jgi:hypothetical protein